jgi:hypothetical protein
MKLQIVKITFSRPDKVRVFGDKEGDDVKALLSAKIEIEEEGETPIKVEVDGINQTNPISFIKSNN